jgi:hypothetical protein
MARLSARIAAISAALAAVSAPTALVPASATAATCVAVTGHEAANPGDQDNVLGGVAVLSPCQAWAVGYYMNSGGSRQTLVEHWNGTSWHTQASPSPGSTSSELGAVTALSAANVWAVGEVGDGPGVETSLALHWNGSAWKHIATPTLHQSLLNGIDAVTAHNIWAVGTYHTSGGVGRALVLHWNGSTWKARKVPQPASATTSRQLNSVSAASSNDVWAVGQDQNGSTLRTVALHWNGTGWHRVTTPNPATKYDWLQSVSALSHGNAWAVGAATNTVNETLVLHWNGTAWKRVKSPDPGGTANANELDGVVATSSTRAYAVGEYNNGSKDLPLLLRWDGKSWKRVAVASDSDGAFLYGVDASSAGNVWAVGFEQFAGTTDTLALHCC